MKDTEAPSPTPAASSAPSTLGTEPHVAEWALLLTAMLLLGGAGAAYALASVRPEHGPGAPRPPQRRVSEPAATESPPALPPRSHYRPTFEMSVETDREERAQAREFLVSGTATYPDGVVLIVTVRHSLSKRPFASVRATVKDFAFHCRFGPFAKAIPGGSVVLAATFLANAQTNSMQLQLLRDRHYTATPPAPFDLTRITPEVVVRVSGSEDELDSIKLEKSEIGAARKRLLDAYKGFQYAIATDEAGAPSQRLLGVAMSELEEDVKAAADVVNRWTRSRACLLFAARFQQLVKLRQAIRDACRAWPTEERVRLQGAIAEVAADLEAFLDDPDAPDEVSPR